MYNLVNNNVSENKYQAPWEYYCHNANNYDLHTETLNNILTVLQDKTQARQIRHYISHFCSKKNGNEDEIMNTFCRNLMHTYLYASFLLTINDKYEPVMYRWTDKFNRALTKRLGSIYD